MSGNLSGVLYSHRLGTVGEQAGLCPFWVFDQSSRAEVIVLEDIGAWEAKADFSCKQIFWRVKLPVGQLCRAALAPST